MGWAFAHKKAGDGFNKKMALKIAHGRIESGTQKIVPHDVDVVAGSLYQTAKKYYSACDGIGEFSLIVAGKPPVLTPGLPF